MCVLLPSGETRNYINIRKERSRLWDHSLPTSPTSSPHSSAPLFKEDRYSSTSEEESEADEVTFTHGKNNGTFSDQHAERPTLTPMPSDYTTQGDPDASPSNLFKSNDMSDEFLGTNNFFMPDGSNRRIHQIDNKVFHAGYLENGNNAYLLELPAIENMLNTCKFLMDEMSGQFYAVYGNSYQRMSTKPMLQQAWAAGDLINELAVTRQAFGYTGLAGSTPPLATGTQPTASTSQQPDDLLPGNRHRRLSSTSLHLLNSPGQRHASLKTREYRYTTITYRQSLALNIKRI